MDVFFAVMPFANMMRPALGVSLLQSAVAAMGISSRVRYFNLDFAEEISLATYTRIAQDVPPESLVGEWLFAESAFGDQIPDGHAYLDKFLSGYPGAEGNVPQLLRLRARVGPFIEKCAHEIIGLGPRVVGFTTAFHQTCACLAVASRLKQAPNPPIVVFGGANCEGQMGVQMARSFPWIDYVCTGEGDAAFPDFLRRLLRGERPVSVAGIVGRQSGPSQSDPEMIRDLDTLPIPDFDDYYAQLDGSPLRGSFQPELLFESSRGCWWGAKSHCTFCGLNGKTMAYRSKSPERVIRELRSLSETYSATRFCAVDNILDPRYIRDVFPRLRASGVALTFMYETKVNLTFDQLSVLRAGGVRVLQTGIESLSNEALRLMRKGCTGLQNIRFLRWCEELGIFPLWNLLYGFPGESPAEFEIMARLIPLISHLTPPSACGPFRLDRFSPMFMHSEAFGLAGVRPHRAYYYAFPLGRQDLSRLAYYFEFDYADGRDPKSYASRVEREIARWTSLSHQPQERQPVLDLHREGDAVIVKDTRPCAIAPEHRLEGLAAELYLLCDNIRGLPGLLRELAARADDPAVRDVLDRLIAAGLMAEMEGQYLSLAVVRDRSARPATSVTHGDLPVLQAADPRQLLHPV
jgi:ribosomal peptide maturation radical SAM protein 1